MSQSKEILERIKVLNLFSKERISCFELRHDDLPHVIWLLKQKMLKSKIYKHSPDGRVHLPTEYLEITASGEEWLRDNKPSILFSNN